MKSQTQQIWMCNLAIVGHFNTIYVHVRWSVLMSCLSLIKIFRYNQVCPSHFYFNVFSCTKWTKFWNSRFNSDRKSLDGSLYCFIYKFKDWQYFHGTVGQQAIICFKAWFEHSDWAGPGKAIVWAGPIKTQVF